MILYLCSFVSDYQELLLMPRHGPPDGPFCIAHHVHLHANSETLDTLWSCPSVVFSTCRLHGSNSGYLPRTAARTKASSYHPRTGVWARVSGNLVRRHPESHSYEMTRSSARLLLVSSASEKSSKPWSRKFAGCTDGLTWNGNDIMRWSQRCDTGLNSWRKLWTSFAGGRLRCMHEVHFAGSYCVTQSGCWMHGNFRNSTPQLLCLERVGYNLPASNAWHSCNNGRPSCGREWKFGWVGAWRSWMIHEESGCDCMCTRSFKSVHEYSNWRSE